MTVKLTQSASQGTAWEHDRMPAPGVIPGAVPETLVTPEPRGQEHGLELLSTAVFWGCNIYDRDTVITQDVRLGAFAGQSSNRAGAQFTARYIERFGVLCAADGESLLDKDFIGRLRSDKGVSFAEILFRAVLAVEAACLRAMRRISGPAYKKIHPGTGGGQSTFVWSCSHPDTSRRAAEVGLIGLTELLPDELTWSSAEGQDGFNSALAKLLRAARRYRPLPPAAILLDAVTRRGIPWEPVGGNILRLGEGKFQHHIWSTVTSRTSRVADRLAQDKIATRRVLADLGLPVPKQMLVSSLREARAAAQEIGYPVVLKPLVGNTGKGVSANLTNRAEVPAAFKRAREIRREILVESFVDGQDYRILVVGNRVVAVARRIPPRITGDGWQTILQLIEELNADPLRDNFRRVAIKLDSELDRLLERDGLQLDTVLPANKSFQLRSTANVSTGGTTEDVTDVLHPENGEMAVRAAEAIGLDVAGVDFLTTDISRSYREVGGGIIEVNSRPGLKSHVWPASGKSRDAGGAIIETMFPPGEQGRVPVAIAAGPAAKSVAVAARSAEVLRGAGVETALVPGDENAEADRTTDPNAEEFLEEIRRPLRDPRLEALVHSTTLGEVTRRGLLVKACETCALLDRGDSESERLGLDIVRRATAGRIIQSAQRDLPDDLASLIGTERLVLVSAKGRNALLRRHLDAGGAAVVARNGPKAITISLTGFSSDDPRRSASVARLPMHSPPDEVEIQLFATALAHGMGVPPSAMRPALAEGLAA